MVKKLFVLASVTALTGLMATAGMAGCSSTTSVVDTGDSSGPVTGKDSAAPPVGDSSVADPDTSTGPGTCPDTTPVTGAEIEMSIAPAVWAPPGPTQSVCTQQNIDDLRALFAASPSGVKYTDIQTKLGAACGACTFSMTTDKTWSQFVQDGTNGYIDNTFGSCLAQLEGSACGKAAFELDQCLSGACPQATCTDQTKCGQTAGQTTCKALGAAANTACPNFQADLTVCATLFSTIEVNCGGGRDAGLDASN